MKRLKHRRKKNIIKDEEENRINDMNEASFETQKNRYYKKFKSLKENKSRRKHYKRINYFFLVLLIIETFILITLYIILKNKSNNNKIKSVLKKDKNIFLKECKEGILTKNAPFLSNNRPIISVVIPLYNSEKSIKSTIRSIQNQNMEDIEIILINDLSTDNTKTIIEEIQKEDQRIKIINNNNTMGKLYSRCVGVLEAKGKYIASIDSDNTFYDNDVFDNIYNQTEENYIDIISFKGLLSKDSDSKYDDYDLTNIRDKNNYIIRQPELGIFPINENYPLYKNNILLSGKLIKHGVFRAAVNILGKTKYSNYMIWEEDTTLFFIICNAAQSFKFVEIYGLVFFTDRKTNSLSIPKDDLLYGDIFLIDTIFDISKNENKKMAVYKLLEIKDKDYFSLSNEKNKNLLKIVVKKIIYCEIIEEKDKEEIKKKFEGNDLFN